MPIYEYQCAKCDKITELIQKFSDPPLDTCPECGAKVTRLVSRTSFQLKGTGWYATDYKKGASSSPAPSSSSKKEEKAPETKVETKTESASPAGGHKCSGGNCH